MVKQDFSVLICVCGDDDKINFKTALESITLHQILKPNEVILVLDGLVDSSLTKIAEDVFKKTSIKNSIIRNATRRGLAYSLNKGLKHCNFNWVARMDADDISMPERFSKQMQFLSNNPSIAVLGTAISEFDNTGLKRYKKAICESNLILKILKFRNPMNHPSCVINKDKVLSVGGYPILEKNQDYGLWILLAAKGFKFANLDEMLLKFRISDNFYKKRGISLIKNDYFVLLIMIRAGFISLPMFIVILIARTIFRALPPFLLKISYSLSRR